jgi:hypothetical protein
MAHTQTLVCAPELEVQAYNTYIRRDHASIPQAKRNFEIIGEYKDRHLESLWRETKIGNIFPWEDIADEAERLLAISKGG